MGVPSCRFRDSSGNAPKYHRARYGDYKSLEAIEAQAEEIAAILVEPVTDQGTKPAARDFLHSLRNWPPRKI